jgi:hypothetical protein
VHWGPAPSSSSGRQLAQRHSEASSLTVATRKHLTLQTIIVAPQSTQGRMIRSQRTSPTPEQLAPNIFRTACPTLHGRRLQIPNSYYVYFTTLYITTLINVQALLDFWTISLAFLMSHKDNTCHHCYSRNSIGHKRHARMRICRVEDRLHVLCR